MGLPILPVHVFCQLFHCDRGIRASAGRVVQNGQLIATDTDCGIGIRTATAKELKDRHQPTEQIDGQMTMTLY